MFFHPCDWKGTCCLIFCFYFLAEFASAAVFSPYEKRPRLLIYNGHMMFHAGEGRNISFVVNKTSGSTVSFGDLDIQALPSLGTVQEFRRQLRIQEGRQNNSVAIVMTLLEGYQDLRRSVEAAQTQLDQLRLSTTPSPEAADRGLKRQVRRLSTSLAELKRTIEIDECASRPCQNGGTCIDAVGKHYCLCLPEFTGPNCADDVNECLTLRGSTLTCQNGGTCLNVHGGFQCQCPPQWHGYRCTEKHDDCASSSPFALCGPHGTCVTVQRSQPGMPAYKCLCEVGWISDSAINPRCVDVNECAGSNPCYPGVPCINTPGSFRCGACPRGNTGNGLQCWDIDECAQNNGGCSRSPRVQCMNTQGSYYCGPCPPGFRGDGRTCRREASCSSSPCNPNADCFEMPESDTGYRCQCRNGLVGNGIGASGCTASAFNPCRSSPCLNGGTCQATSSSSFTCHCRPGYLGPRCARASPCMSSPCRNGGTCIVSATGYTCRCSGGYYGGRCELAEDSCGRHYQLNETGSFTFPSRSGDKYRNSHICSWSITTTQLKVLNITFPAFDLEGSSASAACKYDNLTMYDGADTQAPLIGTYCGRKGEPRAPDPYVLTSSNKIHMIFMSDRSVQRTGFQLDWRTVMPGCGSRKAGESTGRVTSVGFPRAYPQFQHCRWVLSNLPGFQYRVAISPVSLIMEDANCTGDMLEVRDGQRTDDPILAQICTSQSSPTAPLFTSMPYLFIYFRSVARSGDQRPPNRSYGFSVSYVIQQLDKSCGAVLTSEGGFIRTPNYNSGFYYSNLNCIWIIDGRARSASRVQLTFVEFDVRGSRSYLHVSAWPRRPPYEFHPSRPFFGVTRRVTCRGDYVEIRNGGEESSPLITYLCGSETPSVISSTGPQMWIKFHSDTNGNGRGFEAIYSTKCGGVFESANGTIQTPNFPEATLTAIECDYEIKAPTTHAIQITFTAVNLGNEAPFINCTDNFVEMYSLPKTAQHNRKYCRIPEDRLFTGSGGSFTIRFVSNGSTRNKGFQAIFKTFDVGCGGVLGGERGLLRSPSSPLQYLDHMYCRWQIEVPAGKVARLTFNAFSIEEHRFCDYDYVSIYESYESENSSDGFLGKFCGMLLPPPLISSTNTLVVLFVTDFSINSGGFEAAYDGLDLNTSCDRSYTANSGTITSMRYPDYVSRPMECEYRIHVDRGYRIMLTVENITMPCNYAYLEIKNGPNALSPSINGLVNSRLCDDSFVRSLRSQGNALYMVFKLGRTQSLRSMNVRFSINYTVLAESCGGIVGGISGAIASPQYPLKSNQAYGCIYYIAVADGNRASFYLAAFDMYNALQTPCLPWASRLEIRDGPDALSPLMKRVCRSEISNVGLLVASSNRMTVRYVQLGMSAGASGFIGHFSTLCSGILLTGRSGRLASPGFGILTPADRACQWTIAVTPGNLIIAQFIYFQIGNRLASGRNDTSVCTNGYLELNPKEILAVTLNNEENVTNVAKFCNGGAIPEWIYSNTHQLSIKFVSGRGEPENHFALEWSMSGNSCGGTYTEATGVIAVQKNFGSKSDLHICQYTISAPPGMQIALTVDVFGINEHTNRDCGPYYWTDGSYRFPPVSAALYVFNAPNNASSSPQHTLCTYIGGASESVEITSAGSDMFLDLFYWLHSLPPGQANDSLVFMANYSFLPGGCGANLTNLQGFIVSPSYPNAFSSSDECSWLITIPVGYIIEFVIIDFNIGADVPNCRQPSSYRIVPNLAIFDGKNDSFPPLARYCGSRLPANPRITSAGNQLFVRFSGAAYPRDTVIEQNPRGFKANYSISCGARLTAGAEPRVLNTQTLPLKLLWTRQFFMCDWTIVAERPGDKVRFAITYADHPPVNSNVTICEFLYTEVYDSMEPRNDTLLDRFCSSAVPPPFISTGSALFVRNAMRPWYRTGLKFTAVYSSASSYCGGDYYSLSGRFTSPGYPSNYPPNTECVWTITAGAGSSVEITFTAFNLEDSEDCAQDFLEIRQNDRGGRPIARMCSNSVPTQVFRVPNKAWLRFRSDEDGTAAGFELSYVLVFGGTLSSDAGVIESPFYFQRRQFGNIGTVKVSTPTRPSPGAIFPPFSVWRVVVTAGRIIILEFDDFLIPVYSPGHTSQPACVMSSLKVYDGMCREQDASSTSLAGCSLLESLCDINLPSPVQSSSSQMTLELLYRYELVFPRFKLRWSSMSATNGSRPDSAIPSKACGESELAAGLVEKTLTSPGFPYGYAHNLDCVWLISHPRNYSISVNITNLALEGHPICKYDSLVLSQDAIAAPGQLHEYDIRQQVIRLCGRPVLPRLITFTRQTPLKVRFHTDRTQNLTGFSFTYKLACGSDFIVSGRSIITSPNYPNNYPNGVNCTWILRARRDRVLQLRFVALDLQASAGCVGDFVQIYNGAGYDSPSFGRFCGYDGRTFESTANAMRVYFRSDAAISAPGFLITVEEKKVDCSDDQLELTYESPSGQLRSPNFPQSYQHSLDCVWIIRSPSGTRIQFDFDRNNFQLERSTLGRCTYDYVEVRDGASPLAPFIGRGRYCGNTAPGSLVSSGNYLFIRFLSDDSAAYKGFLATYQIAKCGGTIVTGRSGVITSPNYPNPYDSHLDCEWIVIAPEGHYINFSFVDILTLGGMDRNCSRGDYVEIRDYNGTGRLYGRFCYPSFTASEPQRTASNRMYVQFKSDSQLSARGFKLAFNVSAETCGGVLIQPFGTVTSPNYPAAFPTNRQCTWRITVSSQYAVALQFVDFNIPESSGRDVCPYDGVKLYDGPNTDAPVIAVLCGPDIRGNKTFTASANEMTVYFYSDVSIVGRGFKAAYKADQPARCGGRVTQSGAVVAVQRSNPRGPLSSTYCHWILETPNRSSNSTTQVTFTGFNLSDSPDCTVERVIIYGDTSAMGTAAARKEICGSKGNFSLVFWQGVVHIVYSSTISSGAFTFKTKFYACGGLRNAQNGVITSPNYPTPYGNMISCQWLLLAPEGVQWRVKLTDLSLEPGPDCAYDNLTIQNGPYQTSPIVRKWCSLSLPTAEEFTSTSRILMITFMTDLSNSGRGFRLEYRQGATTCGSILHGLNGTVTSPNFPQSYPQNDMCQWEIVAPPGYHVEIHFTAFDMQRSPNCTKDYLQLEELRLEAHPSELYPVSVWGPLGDRLCGYDTPNFTISDKEYVRISFKSDTTVTGSGFNLTWAAVCGATFRSRTGRIRSPYYPDSYENRMSCDYIITPANSGTFYTVLIFESMDLEKARLGCHDFVEIVEVNTKRLVGKFCGYQPPAPVSTKGPMRISFRTDDSRVYRGFLARYQVSDCGGDITLHDDAEHQTATITSPAFPAKYHNNMNCVWTITAPEQMILSFKFSNLSMERHSMCNYDRVEIRDGNTANATMIARQCGRVTPTKAFKSTGNRMWIRMYTDNSVVESGGFTGNVIATLGPRAGCGGTVNLTGNTTIKSPVVPSERFYHPHLNCEWHIVAPANRVIRAKVKRFELEHPGTSAVNMASKCYDYLEIHDGYFEGGPLIGRFCGDLDAWGFISSTNQLYLIFVTDQSVESNGFVIDFEPVPRECGASLTATDSPKSLAAAAARQQFGHRCQWRIQADANDARVKIEFSRLQYPQQLENCDRSYIELTDVPKTSVSQSVRVCGTSALPYVSQTSAVLVTNVLEPNANPLPMFSLTYVKYTNCNQTIELRSVDAGGRLTSPNYPLLYRHNVKCKTNLVAPQGYRIFIYFDDFRLENPRRGSCAYDYLMIEEGGVGTSPKYCGTSLPPSYASRSNRVTLTFKTDLSVSMPGYDLTYTFTNQACGGVINGQSGTITSPKYPDRYPPNVQCNWVLKVHRGRAIMIRIIVLSLSRDSRAPCTSASDSLTIFKGETADNSRMETALCIAETLPVEILVESSTALVRFVSDTQHYDSGSGFRLKFDEVTPSPQVLP